MHRFEHFNIAAKQQGAALGVGLILLLAMTLSGVFILNSSIMDERMSANYRSQTNAFLAAEAGLLKSQRFLDDNWNACLQAAAYLAKAPACSMMSHMQTMQASTLSALIAHHNWV